GETRGTMLVAENFQVDVRVIPKESFGAALLYFTGSKPHNIAIRTLGQKAGLKINEYGVFRGKRRIGGQSEEDVYHLLKLPYIEPELRENEGEIQAAKSGQLPKLIQLKDIRGDLHSHTVESDGLNTLEEMAQAAEELGYEYLAITDHTKSLAFVKGLDKKRLLKQFAKIDKLNDRLKTVRLLKSAEVEILEDGSLDFADDVLKQFDIVVCAIHSHFNLSSKKQTDRILRVLDNPNVNILAHPFGRLLGERESMEMDFDKIMRAVKSSNCILEINAQPNRLDLPDHYCRMAGEAGVRFALSTDSHHTSQLGFMKFGVDVARRAWLTKDHVINTQNLKSFMKSIKRS
ncbi:MAG: PHP domain-containing protein, partial [Bdellovibrionales bacterium]